MRYALNISSLPVKRTPPSRNGIKHQVLFNDRITNNQQGSHRSRTNIASAG
jgi:hypothetical protein